MTTPLLHSPGAILRAALVALGLGSEPTDDLSGAWPCYHAFEPAVPDEVITTYHRRGTDDGRTMPDGERQQHYGLQIYLRSLTPARGAAKMLEIQDSLDRLYQLAVAVDGAAYLVHSVNRQEEFVERGKEYPQGARSLFSLAARAAITRTA